MSSKPTDRLVVRSDEGQARIQLRQGKARNSENRGKLRRDVNETSYNEENSHVKNISNETVECDVFAGRMQNTFQVYRYVLQV